MNILVPLAGREHLTDYVKAGASELYFGFHDDAWTSEFGKYADLNRMSGFGQRANPMDFTKAIEMIDIVHSEGARAFITLNSASYTDSELAFIHKYLNVIKDKNIDGLIISSPELAILAQQYNIPIVASTMCGIYNSDIASFYKNLGMKRIILPRDLSLNEIQEITTNTDNLEFEVFLMRNGCVFSDSNCLCHHRPERGALCGCLRTAPKKLSSDSNDFNACNEFELNDLLYTRFFHQGACGLCALYRLEKMGITAGKIVGRADDWRGVCDDIRIARENISIAKHCGSEKEYLTNMLFPANKYEMCKLGMNCYYPEVRF